MDVSKLATKEVGNIGEETVARALNARGYEIMDRNCAFKTGELDIVARKDGTLHIFEVKTVLVDEYPEGEDGDYGPELNIHEKKLHTLSVTGEWYIESQKWKGDWQLDAALVWVRRRDGKARIEILEHIY